MTSPTYFVSARRPVIGKFGETLVDQALISWTSKILRSAVDAADASAGEEFYSYKT